MVMFSSLGRGVAGLTQLKGLLRPIIVSKLTQNGNSLKFKYHFTLLFSLKITILYICCYATTILTKTPKKIFFLAIQLKQMSGHQTFAIQPSRFQWNKFKDSLHFYVMLGIIPITSIVMYANIFIGDGYGC